MKFQHKHPSPQGKGGTRSVDNGKKEDGKRWRTISPTHDFYCGWSLLANTPTSTSSKSKAHNLAGCDQGKPKLRVLTAQCSSSEYTSFLFAKKEKQENSQGEKKKTGISIITFCQEVSSLLWGPNQGNVDRKQSKHQPHSPAETTAWKGFAIAENIGGLALSLLSDYQALWPDKANI